MEITDVRIVLVASQERLKAFASITLDSCFVVTGLRVISGPQGYFVSMPSRRRRDGSYQDILHPINNEARKMIEDKILDAFEAEINKPREQGQPGQQDAEPSFECGEDAVES
ncbi:MAG: septation regulator SpoVG [Chitinispirillia bacterium]|nr:septation regulator SpoVG [Chitinispirillia bacterium]